MDPPLLNTAPYLMRGRAVARIMEMVDTESTEHVIKPRHTPFTVLVRRHGAVLLILKKTL